MCFWNYAEEYSDGVGLTLGLQLLVKNDVISELE